MNIEQIWENWIAENPFSGVFSVADEDGAVFEHCAGYLNRSEKLPNNMQTAFGIASGTKLFTGLAVCKLIDTGKLTLNDRIWDVLPYDLGRIDRRVTLFHLLTHTSGIGDYLDEEAPDCSEAERALCERYPVYLWERLSYYLQMITPLPPKFEPGARFGYSNAGFVLLGLAVEAAAGKPFQRYVTDAIISPLNLKHTGFYRADALPANTAVGYLQNDAGEWRTNVFSLPVVGGSDGGLFTCAKDLDTLWRALFAGQILSPGMLNAFLAPQVSRGEPKSYGLGVYRRDREDGPVYYAVGGDFGIAFFTVRFPTLNRTVSALGNTESNVWSLLDTLLTAR